MKHPTMQHRDRREANWLRIPVTNGLLARLSIIVLSISVLMLSRGTSQAQVSLGNGATVEVLGTGAESLIGGDLTDPEGDGDETLGELDASWNWKSITSSHEQQFDGAESSFNVFDNKVGGGNDKWCCDDPTDEIPVNITVEFVEPIRLTHFTITSGNDTPDRDPLTWQIQGSNDGITFEPIFVHDSDESLWTDVRLQVNKFTLAANALPYTFIRFECTRTSGALYQITEIEYFGELGLGVPKIELLGLGAAALIGGDLTDPDNNGSDVAGPADPSWNWESITSNIEPAFEGGEFSFNIFDNKVGGGNDKWCCDDPSPANPFNVDVKFRSQVVLRYFTITSGNDARDREPLTWQIAGSNDGVLYTPIFVQDSPTSIWTDINQVAKVTLAAPALPYQYIRFQVSNTAGPLHQLNEIEYFGDAGGVSKPTYSGLKRAKDFVRFDITDGADTTLVPASVVVKIDDVAVATTISENGAVTSFTHTPNPPFAFGSVHPYEITGLDNFDNPLRFTGSFTQPTPWFPEADLPGPAPVEGMWATRYIFNAGTIGTIPAVLDAIQAAAAPDFTGVFVDATSEVINHGTGGIFVDPVPYDQAATDQGCCVDDFIMLNIGHIRITEEGDYTFGVHSDDGFGMRIRGGTAISKSGAGELDLGDPEAVVHPANTGDSNTRGVYHLTPGVYRMEFFWWERDGGDHGEIYVAKGAFENDGDTADWKLVGVVEPAQTVTGLGVDAAGWSVVSSDPGGEILLENWAVALDDLAATAGPAAVYDAMFVGDPDTNAGAAAFPKNDVGDQDDFAMRATAKLVIPSAGTWAIGFNSDDGGYVKIAGQTFTQIVTNATALSVIEPSGDQVTCDALTGASNTIAEITLAQGTYDIEAGMFDRSGGGFLQVSGAEAGARLLPIMSKTSGADFVIAAGGVGLTDDPVTTGPPQPPASPGEIGAVEIVGDTIIVTYKSNAAATTASIAKSPDLKNWTTIVLVPTQVGGSLVFTIPRSAEPIEYYRVLEP